MHDLLLSAVTWDPQIRGALILIAAILILPGSVYLLLATNVGAKIGFILAITGLAGWMFVMAVVWAVFGIGLRGREAHWKTQEIVTGNVGASTVEATEGFPRGWKSLPPGDKIRADAQAAVDAVLAPSAGAEAGHAAGANGQEQPRFASPFKKVEDYVTVSAYHRGGDNELFTIGAHKFYLRHSPHHAVVQVRPALKQEGGPGGAPPTPVPDPNQPATSVIMVRDLGSLRFPPVVVALCSLLIFGVCCYWLHIRDKQIWAIREGGGAAGEPAPAAT